MNTCDSCKWWNSLLGDRYRSEFNAFGKCRNEKLEMELPYSLDGLSAGESSSGEIPTTGPKFGCIHHEIKQ